MHKTTTTKIICRNAPIFGGLDLNFHGQVMPSLAPGNGFSGVVALSAPVNSTFSCEKQGRVPHPSMKMDGTVDMSSESNHQLSFCLYGDPPIAAYSSI